MIFHCLVRNDQTNTVHSRTIYLIEIFFAQILFGFSEVIVGLLNLRYGSFFYAIGIGVLCSISAHIIMEKRFNEDRGRNVIQSYSELISRKKVYLVLLGFSLFIGAFIFLILNGMLMSYLFSLYKKAI